MEKDEIIAYYDGCLRFIGIKSSESYDGAIMSDCCLFNGNIYRKNQLIRPAYYREDVATDEEKGRLIKLINS